MQEFFLLNFHKNDVISNLADTFPWDYKFAFFSEESEKAAGTGNDQSSNAAGFAVKFKINGTAKTPTGTDIDNFFLL